MCQCVSVSVWVAAVFAGSLCLGREKTGWECLPHLCQPWPDEHTQHMRRLDLYVHAGGEF